MGELPMLHVWAVYTAWAAERCRLGALARDGDRNEDAYVWMAEMDVNDMRLRLAFLRDTADRNHWSSSKYVELSFVLRLADLPMPT